MCEQDGHDPDAPYGRPYATWKGPQTRRRWQSYVIKARAALEAALNPMRAISFVDRKSALAGIAVSAAMVGAAQSSYAGNPEYGLTDEDMKNAIKSALDAALSPPKTNKRDGEHG